MASPQILTIENGVGARSGQHILRLNGRLNFESVFRFEQAVQEVTAPSLIVDLSQVSHIDSAGLGSLVRTHVSRLPAGRRLAFVGVNERVGHLLAMAGLSPVLAIFETLDKAEEELDKSA